MTDLPLLISAGATLILFGIIFVIGASLIAQQRAPSPKRRIQSRPTDLENETLALWAEANPLVHARLITSEGTHDNAR